jgi:hypothetical protein
MPWMSTDTLGKPQQEQPDVFREISSDSALVALSQRVLASYARDDWRGIYNFLPIQEKFNQRIDQMESVVLADIAGGTGSLLSEIERSCCFPSDRLDLICLEQPEVVDYVKTARCTSNSIKFIAGDLFSGSLPAANLYLLSRVLHDWDDNKAKQILQRINQQSPKTVTLCVIDRQTSSANNHALLLLYMYLQQRSYERNSEEWTRLFDCSDWKAVDKKEFNGHIITTLEKTQPCSHRSSESVAGSDSKPPIQGNVTVKKAVVPIAGLATRMMPQSLVIPKALLIIFTKSSQSNDSEVQIKPALSNLLDQLLVAGFEAICIVAAPSQEIPILRFLQSYQLMRTRNNVLNPILMSNIVRSDALDALYCDGRVQVLWQQAPLGLGDAVLTAEKMIGNEPFLVAPGDHVYSPGCVQDILVYFT